MHRLFKPFVPEDALNELNKILDSGTLSTGIYTEKFESELRNYFQVSRLLTVSSYNHALLILISTLGLKEGDEILASPMSCLASNQPFASKGIKVTWVDVQPDSGMMCPEDLARKVSSSTKAVVINHFCGYVADVHSLKATARAFGLQVVEDCIESFGSISDGDLIGRGDSDFYVFSFQSVRLPNTIDGGALIIKDKDSYEKAVLLRDYGIDRSNFRDFNGEINEECDVSLAGYGGVLNNINSFFGHKQMNKVDDLLIKQRQNAVYWKNYVQNKSSISVLKITPNTIPNYWVFGLICDNKEEAMNDFRSKGFHASGVHADNSIYSVFGHSGKLPGVEKFKSRFLAIPSGWWINL